MAVMQQGLALGHGPRRRRDLIATEPTQRFDPEVAVDQHESIAIGDYDHRDLLPMLGDRRDQSAATIDGANPQVVMSKLEPVQVHVHANTVDKITLMDEARP